MDRPPPLPPELLQALPDAVRTYIDSLNAVLDALQRRIAHLETQLNQNSTNSSKPPSTDSPAVKRAPPNRGVWDYLTCCVAAVAEGRALPSLLMTDIDAHAA